MTDAGALTITDFLLARIAEDEARTSAAIDDDGGSDEGFSGQQQALSAPPSGVGIAKGGFGQAAAEMIATYAVPARVLAECKAKREIVEECERSMLNDKDSSTAEWIAAHLATVYASHPDCDPEWADMTYR